jgi:hypothetical protein
MRPSPDGFQDAAAGMADTDDDNLPDLRLKT